MSKLFEDMARAMQEANARISKLEEKKQEREKRWGWI